MDNISKLYADVSKKLYIGTEDKIRGLLSTKEGAEKFYNVMKDKGVDLGNHTDFMVGLGHENLVEEKDAPPVGVNTEWNTDVDLATSAAKEAKYQADLAKNKLEWTQKQKPFGGSKPFGRVDLGMNDKVVKSDNGQWLTESGRTYDNFTEANLDQNLTDQHNSQSYRLSRMEEQLGEMKDRSGELLKESKKEDEKKFSQALGMGTYYGSMMRHESPNTTAIRKAQADLDDAQEALNELYRQRAEGGETNYIKNSVDFWKNLGSGNIKDAAKNLVDAGNDGLTTLKRVGRGFSDTAGDLSNWDFGVTDATHEGTLLSAILKRDNGQPLTKQEQFMLDSAALRAGVTNEVGDLGLAYTSGNVTAASLPFMIEMMANPLSGLGKGATKALTKYVVKKYGKEAVKNNMKKYLAAKAVSRVSGDIAGSLGMTATSGFAGTAANAAERQIGSVQTAYDENGNIVYGGHVGGEDALTAWTKAFADRTIENWSEMSGAYFAALGAPIKAAIGKGIGRLIPEKMLQSDFAQWATRKYGDFKNSKFSKEFNRIAEDIKKSKVYKGVDAFKENAQIGGLFEEYLEEKFGDLMRLSIGDTTFDTNSETGIFNLERNVETLVSLIPTQVGFGMLRLGGARTANYQYRQQRKAADKYLDGVLGENWKALRMQLDAAQHDPTAIAQIYSNMNQIGGNIPINVRRAVMNYINAQQSVLHSDPALYQSRTDRVDIQEQDGKFVASDKDAMGNVLGNKTFETREEADAYATNRMEETRDDDMHRFMQTARGLNMMGYNQTAEQFMQERGFDNMTAEEQAEFLDEMSSGRGKTGKAWIEFKTKTIENNMSGANFAISSWEQAHGLEPGTIENILDRQPTERTIEENDILSEAYGMLHDLAYPQGKAHVEQSKLDGIRLADEANLDAVMDVNEEGTSEAKPDLAELAQLKLDRETSHNIALNTLRSDTDMLTVFGEVMGNNGADAETVIQTLASMDEETLQNTLVDVMNEGVHTEKFQSVVDAVNAQAKYNAFIQRTGEKIDEKVERESNRRVFKGTLNGAQYTDKPTIITAQDGEHTYQIVNSTEEITTDVHGNVTSQGVFTAIDENGNVAVFKGSTALRINAEEELPTFAETMRQGLQEAASEIIEPTTEEEIAVKNTEGAAAETQSQPTENAGAADAAAMPQPTENTETEQPTETATMPQTASEEVQEEEKPSYTKSKMVYDEKGNEAYDRMPIADTMEDLLDGQLEDEQVAELIDNNIEAYEKEVAKLNEKKPKKTTSKSELIAATNKLKADRVEAERKLKYWQDVKAELAKITHTTEEEMTALSEAENPSDAELGIAGGTGAVGGATDTMPVDAVAMASGFLGNNAVKITPESFRAETGFGTKEQRGFVGMFAGKAKGGKTINEIAEALVEYDNAYYGGNYFKGDSQEARNAIIGAFGQARTRADLRANAVSNRDTLLSEWKQKRDDYYYEEFGMSYDDYMAYEGEILKDDIRREAGVDTAAMFADADEAREETVAETESQPAENTTEEERETEAVPQSTTTDAKEPFRERAREWSKKTGVDVVLLESIDDVESDYVRGQIIEAEKRNQQVKGWYSQNTGKVFIYMPHAESKEDIETTFIHEVVAHKGLKELLGKSAFDSLCDNVFETMSPEAQAKFLDYVGAGDINNPTEAEKRAAADEYIAHLAEKTDLTDAEKSVWDNIVKMIRTALETLGLSISINDDVLSNLIKASYAEMVKNSRSEEAENNNEEGEPNMGDAISFRVVDDPKVIAELEGSPKKIGYRNVVMNEDGTFSSPMAYWLQHPTGGAKTRVEMDKFKLGEWEEAVEHPEVVDENGKVTLVKPNKKTVGSVAYDPYIHNRLDPVNLQFKEAWKRNDLVYVETEVAEVDLESGYHADKALYPVGVQSWSNGALMLSRYDKPVRILPWDEVADAWVKRLDGKGVEFDVVPPELLSLLAERGVDILPPHKGMGKDCNAAYKEWKKNKTSASERSGAIPGNSSSGELLNESSEHLSHNALASQEDIAKLQKNTQTTLSSAQKVINAGGVKNLNTAENTVRVVANKLKLERAKSTQSYYGELYEGEYDVDGRTLKLRLSTHPATGKRMGDANAEHKVSIVVLKNGQHVDRGSHNGYTEYIYNPANVSLDDAANAIIKGVVNLLNTGIYTDETGKAERKEYPYIDKEGGLRFRIVYHGSGADFEQFDHNHMGEGAGSQVFGWGTYVTESEKIGRDYGDIGLAGKNRFTYIGNQEVPDWVKKDAESIMDRNGGYENVAKRYFNYPFSPRTAMYTIIGFMRKTKKEDWQGNRHLYEVEIPDEKRGNYIVLGNTVTDKVADKVFDGIYQRLIADEDGGYDNPTAQKELKRELDNLRGAYGSGKSGIWKDLYRDVSSYLGSDKEASLFLNELGYVGIKYPAGTIYKGEYGGASNYVIFNEKDLKIAKNIRFRVANNNQEIFVSNAEQAVKSIKQEKATPQQWKAMIQSKGGLKAGEDKWLGLSEWLDEQATAKRSLTKQEVLDFIGENKIKIEEVEYSDASSNDAFTSLKEEYDQWLREGGYDYAWKQLTGRYGDDAEIAFTDLAGELTIDNEEAAAALLGENVINSTRLDYTTEGLENKREIALTVPTIESWNESDDIHFGDAGQGRAVAWARFGETTDSEGNSVLVIDEIQSKRHQEGREQGYANVDRTNIKELEDELSDLYEKSSELNTSLNNKYGSYKWLRTETWTENGMQQQRMVPNEDVLSPEEYNDIISLRQQIKEKDEEIGRAKFASTDGIPDAPFDKNWHELAMKRILRLAAEEGFDKVAWTKGEQQAERYQLSAVVDHISYFENEDGTLDARAYSPYGGYQPIGKTWEEVERYVGKDIAKKMQEGVSESTENLTWGMDRDGNNIVKEYKTISGDNLKVGGEGMKGFYDKMLPSFMNKYGKKWGVKVEEVELPEVEEAGRTMWSVDVTPEMKESVMEGQVMFRKNTLNNEGEGESTQELFLSLQNKEGEEYNDTVNEIADRIVSGRARVGREDLQSRNGAQTQVSAAGEIISADRGRVSETVQQGSDASEESTRELIEKSIENWARQNGVWMNEDDIKESSFNKQLFDEGGENRVYLSEDKSKVTKLFNPYERSSSVLDGLRNISVFNTLFPDTAYNVVGYLRDELGVFRIVMEQPFIQGNIYDMEEYYDNGIESKVRDMMENIGLQDEWSDGLNWYNGKYYVSDTHFGNVVEDKEGEVHIIDANAKYNEKYKKEIFGENGFEIHDVDEDMESQVMFRVKKTFEAGSRYEVKERVYNYYESEELVTGAYQTPHQLLEAVRNKHEEYAWKMNDDATEIECLGRWNELLPKKNGRNDGNDNNERIAKKTERAKAMIGDVAKMLGLDVEVIENTEGLTDKKKTAKGWYEVANGKIVVVLPNHTSNADVMATLLHEGVAHHGLRKMFGEDFDNMLDNVYEESWAQGKINAIAGENASKERIREATEEYLARLAEDINFEKATEQKWWDNIRVAFVRMLRKAGITINVLLTDNELRYLLWRSYQNLKESADSFDEVRDSEMQQQLGVIDGTSRVDEALAVAEDAESAAMPQRTMFRMADTKSQYDEKVDELNKGIEEKGLRGHLGEVPYKKMMRTVYEGNDEIAQNVGAMLQDKEWNLYDSIETYLADEAQTMGNEDMWQDVRQSLADAVDFFPSIKDTKYAMWLNKNRDNDPSDPNDGIKRNALLYKLEREEREAPVRFRTTPTPVADQAARAQYEKALKQLGYRWSEQWIDGTRSVAELQKAMFGKDFHLADSRDAHEAEKAMTSKIMQKQRQYHKHLVEPLGKAIEACMKDMPGKSRKERYENLKKYMYALHGLERNRYIHVRDIIEDEQQLEDYVQYCIQQRQELDRGNIDIITYFGNLDGYIRQNIDKDFDADKIDKSGLRDEFPTDTEALSYILVTEDRLKKERVNELWRRVRDVNDFALETEYQSGLISGELKAKVASMYGWYIPLRGFEEMTAEEEYDYNNTEVRAVGGPTLMGARGRKSKADDPIATMLSIGSQAIHRAERNEVKKKFYRAAKDYMKTNGQGGLVSELWVWEAKVGTDNQGNDIYEVQFPDITEDMSASEAAQKIADFEAQMKDLADKGDARQVRQGMNLNKAFEHKKSLEEHIVRVYENGQVHVLYLNGNPRAAKSLNGTLKTNEKNVIIKAFRKLQRAISQMMTSLNPTFALVANPIRDYQTALMNTLINDGVLAGGKFMLEHLRSFLNLGWSVMTFGKGGYARMFKLYEKGKLDMSKEEHRLFKEFADNGGITGFIESSAIEDYKSMMDGMLRTKTWPTITRFLDKSSEFLSTGNTLMENMARFATYKAARKRGLSIQKSVKRAKDYSLNFNQRGLANGEGVIGSLAWLFNFCYLFVNPTMQAFGMMVNNFKNHPAKTTFYQFAVPPMMASMIVPVLNIILASLLDDDDDDDIRDIYGTMPEWKRRNNICLYAGNGHWVTIPLPIELRAFYGIGETLVSELWGDTEIGKTFGWDKIKSDRPAEWQIFDLLMTLTPTSIVYSGGGIDGLEDLWLLVPQPLKPFAEIGINQKWTGAPIWNDASYVEHSPEWQKAYSNTNPYIVEFCRWLDETTGGNGTEPGSININPAKIDHLIQGYFGGFYKTLSEVGAIGKLIMSGNADAIRAEQVPLLKAIWYNYDEAQQVKRYNALYHKYKEEAEQTAAYERSYTDRGNIDGLLKLMAKPRYKRKEIINDYETERQKFSAGIRKSHAREDEDTEEVFKRIRMLSDKAIVEELDKIK